MCVVVGGKRRRCGGKRSRPTHPPRREYSKTRCSKVARGAQGAGTAAANGRYVRQQARSSQNEMAVGEQRAWKGEIR